MLKKSTAKVHIFRELRNTLRQKLLPQGIISGARARSSAVGRVCDSVGNYFTSTLVTVLP